MNGLTQFTSVLVVDASDTSQTRYPHHSQSPGPCSGFSRSPPKNPNYHPYLLRVTAKLGLQGKDPQPQQGLVVITAQSLLQDVLTELQVELMPGQAGPGKEMLAWRC